ncbi:lipin, putative [Babesia caballi]|uniref:phosphatidate phosphatase n=1 Tax=Babesia caballi TaxID=5871 RepID=A0AAV4LZU4_BABCB|nr:lipin, putative [Babesia caballi]
MWEKLCSSVVSVLDFNQATLSGCVDIICVRHKEVVGEAACPSGEHRPSGSSTSGPGASPPNGDSELRHNERWVYRSTPFHVRFGKTKLLKSREKVVSIYVNGQLSDLTMKLGAAGEAFFDEEGDEDAAGDCRKLSDLSGYAEDDEAEELGQSLMDYGYYACSKSRCSMRSEGSDAGVPAAPRSASASAGESASAGVARLGEPQSAASTPQGGATHPNPDRTSISSGSSPSAASTQESGTFAISASEMAAASERGSGGDVARGWEELRIPQGAERGGADDQILEFSLCGHLLSSKDEALNQQLFEANVVDWDRLNGDPSLWYHASLVARFDNRPPYYPSKIALPLLASWIVFNKPISGDAIANLLRTTVVATRVKPSYPSRSTVADFRKRTATECVARSRALGSYRVSIRPTSDQLASLNLNMGVNRITFTVNSALQGTKSVHARLYLWPSDARIVISDVDGTITKSDTLGHIMPILGRDWSHTGVADLFTKIRANGYYVVYLTARAIGQADSTREYLFGLTQNHKEKLPQGPIFLSPDRLLPSFKREVISRSAYMFKIPALRDIRNLFPPEHNPFYAGFGNNESDHRAYVSVGVPENRVFIINPSGIIRHVNASYARTYQSMSEMAQMIFPPCPNGEVRESEEGGDVSLL